MAASTAAVARPAPPARERHRPGPPRAAGAAVPPAVWAASTAAVAGLAPADGKSRRGRLLLHGARTTIHVACHDADRTEIRVAVMPGGERLEPWCARRGVAEVLGGGFSTRPDGIPLGEVRTHGV